MRSECVFVIGFCRFFFSFTHYVDISSHKSKSRVTYPYNGMQFNCAGIVANSHLYAHGHAVKQ